MGVSKMRDLYGKHKYIIIKILIVLLVLFLWYVFTLNQTSHQRLVYPSLTALINVIGENYGSIMNYSLITWYRIVFGLLIGSLIGFFFGIVMTWSKLIETIMDPFIEIIRPIPPIALTPFFILWFGLGDLGQLVLVSLGCFMVLIVTTIVSIKNVSPIYVRAALSLGASTFNIYKTIYIPAVMPSIASAIRVAAATGFGLTVAAEYLGAQGGLGYLIRNARVTLNTEIIMLAALILGIESLITDQALRSIFGKITRWLPRTNET